MNKRRWPNGRIAADDDGEAEMRISADEAHGVVRIDFRPAAEWIAVTPEQAVQMATALIHKARQVAKTPLTIRID